MPRSYSDKLLLLINREDAKGLGCDLAKLCVKANLPASYVAHALNVTRMSVHSWFRGAKLRGKNRQIVEAFMSLVKKDLASGILPARSTAIAKKYIEEMIGRQI